MDCHFTPLPDEGLLMLEGPQAMTFLQGQCTADTNAVSLSNAVAGACCNVQGRMVFDFLLCQYSDEKFALRMRRDLLDIASSHLAKYIVFSKATLKTGDNQCSVAALWGSDSLPLLESINAAPEGYLGSCTVGGVTVVQVDHAASQFEIYLSHDISDDWQSIRDNEDYRHSPAPWQALQIQAGNARLSRATSGECLPQMLNFDLSGHVNFKKGCYTGQEVVARLHYRGKAKRRLARTCMETTQTPAIGAALITEDSTQSQGVVLDAVVQDKHTELLCSIATAAMEKPLYIEGMQTTPLSLQSLPEHLTPEVEDS